MTNKHGIQHSSRAIAHKAIELTVKNGGCTLDPKTVQEVTTGYAVGGIQEFRFNGGYAILRLPSLGHLEEITEAITEIRVSHPKMKVGFRMDGGTLCIGAVDVVNSDN